MFSDVMMLLQVIEDNCIQRRYEIYCQQSPWDNYHLMMYYTWPVTPILALKHQVVIITLYDSLPNVWLYLKEKNTFPKQNHHGNLIKIHINKKHKYLGLSKVQHISCQKTKCGDEGGGYTTSNTKLQQNPYFFPK